MNTSGYSGTTLAKKLGIKPGFSVKIIHPPENYYLLFSDWPDDIHIVETDSGKKDMIHYFARSSAEIAADIIQLRKEIKEHGMIWISWYKKSSKLETDLSENIIRDIALTNGLVDVKVCAIDEIWSGLKLVIRVKDRKPRSS